MSDKYFYSPSFRGFYNEAIKSLYESSPDGWPEDAIELSEDEYNELLKGQSNGLSITPGKDGKPVLTD